MRLKTLYLRILPNISNPTNHIKGKNMKFQGSVIEEQGVTFAIIIVKKTVISNHNQADKIAQDFTAIFPNMPIVLMAQDSRGVPTYRGRKDIVKFLSGILIDAIPWKEYTI